MSRDPLSVVEEYLGSSEPRIRKNAATALAAIGTEQSLSRLIAVALGDGDEGVRNHAYEELRELEERGADVNFAPVQRALSNPRQRDAANVLLAMRRREGLTTVLPRRGWRERLSLAADVRPALAGERGALSWNAARNGFLGGLLGVLAVVLAIHLSLEPKPGEGYFLLLIFSCLVISPLLTLAAARGARAIDLYFDVRAAALLECAATSLASLVSLSLILLLALSFVPGRGPGSALLGILLGAVYVAAIRGGTLAVFGAVAHPRRNVLVQTLFGGLAGAAVLTGLVVLARHLLGPVVDDAAFFAAGVWVLLLPAGFGVAYAFAGVDAASPPRGPQSRVIRSPRLLGLAAAVLLAALVVFSLLPSDRRPELVVARSGVPEVFTATRHHLPYVVDFRIDFEQNVRVIIEPGDGHETEAGASGEAGETRSKPDGTDFKLVLRRDGERYDVVDDTDPTSEAEVDGWPLLPGDYRIEVVEATEPFARYGFFDTANRWAPIVVPAGTAADFVLELRLNDSSE